MTTVERDKCLQKILYNYALGLINLTKAIELINLIYNEQTATIRKAAN